jgi:hypothetical protein
MHIGQRHKATLYGTFKEDIGDAYRAKALSFDFVFGS